MFLLALQGPRGEGENVCVKKEQMWVWVWKRVWASVSTAGNLCVNRKGGAVVHVDVDVDISVAAVGAM